MPKNWLVKQSPRPAQAVVQEELTQGSLVGDVILAGGSKRRESTEPFKAQHWQHDRRAQGSAQMV